MRSQSLSTANAGMTRLRRKGKASPATLYDCLNAYITIAGTIKARPGTIIDIELPAGTKGLVAHKGIMTVFSSQPTEILDERYTCVTLRHPTDDTLALRDIHFAKPFMGYLYVVAAFEDGSQYHYWTEELDPWEPDTVFTVGERVFGTVPNGFAYEASRVGSPAPKWQPSVQRQIGDIIEPTVHNGFEYVCIAVTGSQPASGTTEPVWPTEVGATIIETTAEGGGTPPDDTEPGDDGDPYDPGDRYDNPYFPYGDESDRYYLP